jgi:photosystem II stability/assembly factor-like uncharacterized protein
MRAMAGGLIALCALHAPSSFAAGAADAVPRAEAAPEGGDLAWRMASPGGGGWIQSLAFDSREPDLLYAGCDVGGFYVSTNAGRTFEIRNRGLHDYFIESIAVHPRDPRVILLGTEGGIHRTTDGGKSWQWIRGNFPPTNRWRFSTPIGAVCFDPRNPEVAYAGVGRPRWDKDGAGAIYRSEDAGASWRRVDGGRLPADAIVSDLEVQPDDSRAVLAATSQGVFRSDDGGASWRPSSEGLPHRYTEELAFAASAPRTVYLTLRNTARDGAPWNGGVFRSDDAGRTWRGVEGKGLPRQVGKDARNLSSSPKEIAADPRDANTVYVGHRDWVTAGLYRSTDGGGHWAMVARRGREGTNMDYGWITQWGPSVECLALSPASPGRIALGTSGMIYLSDDGGASWQQRYASPAPEGLIAGNGLAVTCPWRVEGDPVRPTRIYSCYGDIGLLISDDLGRTFRRCAEGMKSGGNCFGVIVDPEATNTLWAATGWWDHNAGDVCRSDDDGRTWRVVGHPDSGLPDGQVLEMALDPGSPPGRRRLVVISNGHGVFETRDGGASWQSLNGELPADLAKAPRGLLLDPADGSHLIVAVDRQLRETRDGGRTWTRLDGSESLPTIHQLAADPHDFRRLYVAGREFYDRGSGRLLPGGLYRSDDGGRAWRRILAFHYTSGVAVSPARAEVIYVATTDDPYHDNALGVGVLKSADGGGTWRRENAGLTLLKVKCLAVSPHDPDMVFVGTGGNGVFVGRDGAFGVKDGRPASATTRP